MGLDESHDERWKSALLALLRYIKNLASAVK
jgi:hypothetical protein